MRSFASCCLPLLGSLLALLSFVVVCISLGGAWCCLVMYVACLVLLVALLGEARRAWFSVAFAWWCLKLPGNVLVSCVSTGVGHQQCRERS